MPENFANFLFNIHEKLRLGQHYHTSFQNLFLCMTLGVSTSSDLLEVLETPSHIHKFNICTYTHISKRDKTKTPQKNLL